MAVIALVALTACEHSQGGDPGFEAMTAEPQQVQAALMAARRLKAAGEPAGALRVLESLHRRHPDHDGILSDYARLAVALGDDALGQRLLDRLGPRVAGDWRALSARGVLAARRGALAEARRAFTDALALAPDEPALINNLALICALDGTPQQGEALLRQRLAARPSSARMARTLALMLALQGRFDEADRLAGRPLPRQLAAGDPAVLRAFVGLDAPTAFWRAEVAQATDASPPAEPGRE